MEQLTLLFALLFGAVVSVPAGERLGLPAPVLMTVLGAVLALLEFVPNVDVPPDPILPLLLPPLLHAAVRRTSWRRFAANVGPILLLAVALVLVTTLCVAVVAHAIVPGLPLAAVALGAPVAPPDPVAATAVAGFFGDGMDEERRARLIAETSDGRAGTPGDVAATLHWLASPGAAHITSQSVQVNGGAERGH